MDGATLDRFTFRTPTRILIPKLVKSRDGWKKKAGERKKRLKAAKIRNRDLQASRGIWRQRAEEAERKVAELSGQLRQAQQTLVDAHAEAERLREDLKKKLRSSR
jgi:chromosome segregation ATPase